MHVINKALIVVIFFAITSCKTADKKAEQILSEKFSGWWIYGSGQNIFKDEVTLEEWDIIFVNEKNEDLVDLYIAVCEMEYFPMECNMYGNINNDTLFVEDFEITYIQGCGEE